MRKNFIKIINKVVDEQQTLGAEDIADAILSYLEPKLTHENAIQQFIGFVEAKNTGNVINLVESMDLTIEEWVEVRKDVVTNNFGIKE